MTPKEARQFLVKIARSNKYKVIPGPTTFNFYRLLDKVFEYLTKTKTNNDLYAACNSKVIDFFFKETYMADGTTCVLKNGMGINSSMKLNKITLNDVLKEIEEL